MQLYNHPFDLNTSIVRKVNAVDVRFFTVILLKNNYDKF